MRPENPRISLSKNLRNGNPRGDPATAPRCCAKTRRGKPCQGPAIRGKQRCRMHGGNAGAPKGNRNRLIHGSYTAKAIAEKLEVRLLLKSLRQLLAE